MKRILLFSAVSLLTGVSSLLAENRTVVDPGLRWEYYDHYTTNSYYTTQVNFLNYSLLPLENEDGSYQWNMDYCNEWELQRNTDWRFLQTTYPASLSPAIKVEDNKVYMIITPEYAKAVGLMKELPPETRMVLPDDPYLFIPNGVEVELEDDLPVLLYDFEAEVGDTYETVIFGKLLTTATVVGTSFREDILGGVKEVKILTDYSMNRFIFDSGYKDVDIFSDVYDYLRVSYVEKIGNISSGTFVELNPFWYTGTGLTYFDTVINDVYDSEGNIVYKGKNVCQETLGVSELAPDKNKGEASMTYDLHGRAVTNPVPGSIYIRNGKKFVAE